MAQLLVRNVPEAVAKTLRLRAVEHGVSAEEEHRRILQEALAPQPDGKAPEERGLFEHIRQLGQIAPDFEFGNERRVWAREETEI